jgi:hypothetical protein
MLRDEKIKGSGLFNKIFTEITPNANFRLLWSLSNPQQELMILSQGPKGVSWLLIWFSSQSQIIIKAGFVI